MGGVDGLPDTTVRCPAPKAAVSARRRVLAALCGGALVLAAAGLPGDAGAVRGSHSLDNMVHYLQNDQNADGGFGGEPGEASSPGFSAWVAIALAATGVNPRSQAGPGGQNAYSYLAAHTAQMSDTTDFERELLVVDASGTSPHDFGGVDLVARILARQVPQPAQEGVAFRHDAESGTPGMNDTIFAAIALSPIREPAVEAAVQQAANWIEREQNDDGSWPSTCPRTVAGCRPFGKDPEGEADMTAAAIEALNAAGRHHTDAQRQGLEYLRRTQNPTEGGFAEKLGARASNSDSGVEANVGSSAWVTQALWAAGENPESWKPAAVDPLAYIESMQDPDDGHVRFSRTQDMNGVWMTAYSGPALAGVPLPVPAPPYTPPQAPGPGEGVTSGGGGEGAVLFSRPQAQSKGQTPGGPKTSRRTAKQRTHRRNPGAVRRHSALAATTTAESARPGTPGSAAAGASSSTKQRRADGRAGSGAPREGVALSVPAPSAGPTSTNEVTGIPIGSPAAGKRAEPGAPGLKAAAAPKGPIWPALLIAGLAFGLALAGSLVEQRRPLPVP
jgi:hypothetical protein